FFFNDTATTEIYTLSLHDALPILLVIVHVEVVVQRDAFVGPLDQPSAGRVVMGGGQGQAGAIVEPHYGLHQTLAEGRLADDQATVVVLHRAGDDLGRAGRHVVDQDHQGEIVPAVAVHGGEHMLG